ncbi:MAG TPA: hypothetical protein VLJ76_08955 [Gaiellaceae bacterium]|nr:hypothetical protein [Gaiellaceae bacterium]
MRVRGLSAGAVAVSLAALVAGCGGSSHQSATTSHTASTPRHGSIPAMLAEKGPNVSVVPGDEDFAVGPVRFSFLLIDDQGATVYRPRVRVVLASSTDSAPIATTSASLEPIGVPGVDPSIGDVNKLYVAHLRASRAGKYALGIETLGARPVQAATTIVVRTHPQAPAVGSQAIASNTPTIGSTHGNFKELTTRTPPDKGLLRYSVAASLAAHSPFVLVFATPKFCTSRTCGPVVDVVDAVRRQFATTDIRFIHVEVYKNNNPGLGYNRWFKQWRLPTEPWIFLVGADGKIKERFEGSVSVGELAAAVRRNLA